MYSKFQTKTTFAGLSSVGDVYDQIDYVKKYRLSIFEFFVYDRGHANSNLKILAELRRVDAVIAALTKEHKEMYNITHPDPTVGDIKRENIRTDEFIC